MNARIVKYLKGYTILQLCGWSFSFLLLFFDHVVALYCIAIFQVISILEILHAFKKWNNSSPVFCALQISARLLILYLSWLLFYYDVLYPVPYYDVIISILFSAWCIAEVTRYSYYVSELYKKQSGILAWLRYSVFLICYPVGLACEVFILVKYFMGSGFLWVKILIVLVLLAYAIAFPMLYLHLLRQRKKKIF